MTCSLCGQKTASSSEDAVCFDCHQRTYGEDKDLWSDQVRTSLIRLRNGLQGKDGEFASGIVQATEERLKFLAEKGGAAAKAAAPHKVPRNGRVSVRSFR